ncbi:hypothetical protein [Sphingomonas sp.]|uniref:hypothetical protein n=1 Tax=Sphingomonas sp. TaxID=28214 RepID=UPI003B0005EB
MRAAVLLAALIATPAAAQISGVPEPFHGIDSGFSSSPFGRSPALTDPTPGSTSIVGGAPSRPQAGAPATGGRCADGRFSVRSANGATSCEGRAGAVGTGSGG